MAAEKKRKFEAECLDRMIVSDRVKLYDRINADRKASDKVRAEKLTALYLEEDATQARLIAAERQKAEKIEADKIAADRLKEDVKLELEFAEADRRLDAERLEADHRANARRKHRRTDQIDGRSELIADMKRVFAERFEERHGENLPVNEVYDVFRKSTSLSTAEYSVFKHHCRKLFCAQWTHSRVISKGSHYFFTNMEVKSN